MDGGEGAGRAGRPDAQERAGAEAEEWRAVADFVSNNERHLHKVQYICKCELGVNMHTYIYTCERRAAPAQSEGRVEGERRRGSLSPPPFSLSLTLLSRPGPLSPPSGVFCRPPSVAFAADKVLRFDAHQVLRFEAHQAERCAAHGALHRYGCQALRFVANKPLRFRPPLFHLLSQKKCVIPPTKRCVLPRFTTRQAVRFVNHQVLRFTATERCVYHPQSVAFSDNQRCILPLIKCCVLQPTQRCVSPLTKRFVLPPTKRCILFYPSPSIVF